MSNEMQTVLVLDDETVVRESLVDYFEDCGWRVIHAESGEAALELLARESPDGALVDMRLPGMSGDAFIREAHQIRPSLAFIIVTGSPELCRSGGGRIYATTLPATFGRIFEKPIADLSELETALKNHVRNHKGATP